MTTPITRRSLLGGGLLLGTAAGLSACGLNSNPAAGPSSNSSPVAAGKVVVGGANFTESSVLANIYSQALTAKGVESSTKLNIGSRELYIRALQDGSINAFPEYTGNLLQYFDKDTKATTAEEVEQALPAAVGKLKVLDASKAVDQDVYVVTKQFSEQNGVTSLADLSKLSGKLTLGGPTELQQRPYGPPGLKGIYNTEVTFKAYDSPAVKVKDLNDNKIQIGEFFTTDSAIGANGYVMLADPQSMILPQNIIPLVSADVSSNNDAVSALNAVQAALTTAELSALNAKVDTDKEDPAEVAKGWLTDKGLI